MTDAEFVEEIAKRLNLLLEADQNRAQQILTTPMVHVQYANVGHFLGQLGLPRGLGRDTPPEDMREVKFLMPVIDENGRIKEFEAVTGQDLEERAAQSGQGSTSGSKNP